MTKHVFIVAELSANHCQNKEIALKTIDAIAESGADAVKVQTFTPDSLTLDLDGDDFMANPLGPWAGQRYYDLYKKAALPFEWHAELKSRAEKLGLEFFSAPFSLLDVDFLENLGISIYKVASLEINDIPLIQKIAKTQKKIIISTGIASLSDIELAIKTCHEEGNFNISLLKCVTKYPTPYEDVNLNNLITLKEMFGCEVGVSDHSIGLTVPLGAVALGASIIEKHFILDKSLDSPDAFFSMSPSEFSAMVQHVRQLEVALGKKSWNLAGSDIDSQSKGRSLYAAKNIKKGERFTSDNIKSIRSSKGLHTKEYWYILDNYSLCDIEPGTPISYNKIYPIT